MSLPFSDVVLPIYDRGLAGLSTVVGKAQTFCADGRADEAAIVSAKLTPDMLAFAWQVKLATDHAINGLRGACDGRYTVDKGKPPEALSGLADLVKRAREELASVDPGQIDALVGRAVLHFDRGVTFGAPDFLLGFSLPNFFFHLVTAYDVLRAMGVPIGKSDYLGPLPTRP